MTERYYNTLGGNSLLSHYSISIRDGAEESKYVRFHSKIHKNKVRDVSFCYSQDFSDLAILSDETLVSLFYECYGTDVFYKR